MHLDTNNFSAQKFGEIGQKNGETRVGNEIVGTSDSK